MKQASFEEIIRAEKDQKGGKYRLVAQRKIDGHSCRCYARVFMVGMVAYWNVYYVIDGRIAETYNPQIKAMYEVAQAKADDLCTKGKETILWAY